MKLKNSDKNISLEIILDKIDMSKEEIHSLQTNEFVAQIKDLIFDSNMLLKVVKNS